MNNFRALLEQIEADLQKICLEITRLNENHVFDIERSAERFFCGLLNWMEDWNLTITNRTDATLACVDLIDPNAGIAVAVRITLSEAGMAEKIEEFCSSKLSASFHTFILLTFSPIPGIDRQGCVQLWNTDTLLSRLRELPEEQLGSVAEYLMEYIESRAGRPPYLLPSLPPAAENFVAGSRNQDLKKLGRMLKGRKPIFIWGVGGIGKTETAIQLAKQFAPPRGAYLLRCPEIADPDREILKETILAANISGYQFAGTDSIDHDQEYQERLDILRQYYRGAMLIIDNLDSPCKNIGEIQDEQSYRDLLALPLQLVFTTRSIFKPEQENQIEIGRLCDEALLRLMRTRIFSDDYPDAELQMLIDAVDGHTLMVDLMACLLEESMGDTTPRQLLDALSNARLGELPYFVTSEQNRRYKSRQIYAHLKVLFDISNLSTPERDIMRYATLLPEDGMDTELFRDCLNEVQQSVLPNLISLGWIQEVTHEDDCLCRVHPVIQQVCRGELMPTDENCGSFLDSLCNRYRFFDRYPGAISRQIADCLSRASSNLEDLTGNWTTYAGLFFNALKDTDDALIYNRRAEGRRFKSTSNNPIAMAETYNSIGIAYWNNGDYSQSLDYHLKALDALRKFPVQSEQVQRGIAITYSNIGNTYTAMGDYHAALDYQRKALAIREQILPPDHPQLAASYNNVGISYGELEDQKQSLDYLEKALEIRKKILPADHPDLAKSYSNVGLAYSSLGRHHEALDYQLRSLNIFQKSLSAVHTDLAFAYNFVGLTYDALNDHQRALKYKLDALGIFEEVLPPDHPELARSYNNIGSTYSALNQHQKALEYKLKALHIRERELPNHPDLAISYDNVASTYIAMDNYQKALEYAQTAMAIRQKALPVNHPHLVSSYQNVGLICFYLNDFSKALEYLQKALSIWEDVLPAGHPHILSIRDSIREIERIAAE